MLVNDICCDIVVWLFVDLCVLLLSSMCVRLVGL